MRFSISVPSKTFLLGEYLALKGGPAILAATKPRFEMLAVHNHHDQPVAVDVHPESQAGRLIKKYRSFYDQYHITFRDPYHGQGGFGYSSAQFAMLEALRVYLSTGKIDYLDLYEEYIQLSKTNIGFTASGADLIAQLSGGICYFHKHSQALDNFTWPFTDINYALLRTKFKLPTHFHLQELNDFDTKDFSEAVLQGIKSIKNCNSELFINAINQYRKVLDKHNMIAAHTKKILDLLATNKDVLAMKGCGALGSDVILIIFARKEERNMLAWLEENALDIVYHGNQVENGIVFNEISQSAGAEK